MRVAVVSSSRRRRRGGEGGGFDVGCAAGAVAVGQC